MWRRLTILAWVALMAFSPALSHAVEPPPRVVRLDYSPHPKQVMFHTTAANEVLFGGAKGGAKSHALLMEAYLYCQRIRGLHAFIFRRTYPELLNNHILRSLMLFPRETGKYVDNKHFWQFNNGSYLHFCHCQHEKDVFSYQGVELHWLGIDEVTLFTEFMYDQLCSCNRSTLDVPAEFRHKIPGRYLTGNPGGIGHYWVMERFVDAAPPLTLFRARDHGRKLRVFIPSLVYDNPSLMLLNPDYIKDLEDMAEPYRSAYLEGKWDVFAGQAFRFSRQRHVLRAPLSIPPGAPLYCTFDWGYRKPFSVGWWWVDRDARLYRFHEWYGWNGRPNEGVGLLDRQIASGIVRTEAALADHYKIKFDRITRLCDPTCFNREPPSHGARTADPGPSTADIFAEYGLEFQPGNPDRLAKIREFRTRLEAPRNRPQDRPLLMIYPGCAHFIRTIPTLQIDSANVEDIPYRDSGVEDHVYDEACHVVMHNPLAMETPPVTLSKAQRDWQKLALGPTGRDEEQNES